MLQTNFRSYCPPAPRLPRGRTPKPQCAASPQSQALNRYSAPYLLYVPGRTSHAREALSRAPPPEVHGPFYGRTKPPRRPASQQAPSHAHRRRFHDAGPGIREEPMERRPPPSEPRVAPAYSSQRHASSAGSPKGQGTTPPRPAPGRPDGAEPEPPQYNRPAPTSQPASARANSALSARRGLPPLRRTARALLLSPGSDRHRPRLERATGALSR